MRRKTVLVLVILNCLLGIALFARAADSQIIPLGIFNCCKDFEEEGYCCFGCCWFNQNCFDDEDCGTVERRT